MSSSKLDACLQWATKNGASIDELVRFNSNEKTGISATLDPSFDAQSLNEKKLIEIPKELLITRQQAKEAFPDTDESSINNVNGLTQIYLANLMFNNESQSEIIRERQEFFRPYLDVLPQQLSQPYFWPLDKLEILKKTDIYVILKQNLRNFITEWKSLLEELDIEIDHDNLSFLLQTGLDLDDDSSFSSLIEYIQSSKISMLKNEGSISWKGFFAYLWASCIFLSRAFPAILINEKCTDINEAFLLPIVDLLNHKNDTNVKWKFLDNNVVFFSNEQNFLKTNDKPNNELFNNYGDKSNEELLLGYGFVEENNSHDICRLTMRLDNDVLQSAKQLGVNLLEKNLLSEGCVQFQLTEKDPLPKALIDLFGYLCKLKVENNLTRRSILEGSDELSNILNSKLTSTKNLIKSIKADNDIGKMLKLYLTSHRKLLNKSIEQLARKQKQIIQTIPANNMISFKSIFKSDKMFANAMLLRFGVIKFEDLVTKNCLNKALMLWIVRVANQNSLERKLEYSVPDFILKTFEDVASTIVVQKEDVTEYMSFYKELFPHLSQKLPDVFGKGDWGIKQFIIADTVIDRIVWIRKTNDEPFFIKKEEYNV